MVKNNLCFSRSSSVVYLDFRPVWRFRTRPSPFGPVARERVPCPKPRLASDETSRLIASIEVAGSVRSGSDKPNSSHRIFGLYAGRFFLFPTVFRFQTVEIFIQVLLCRGMTSSISALEPSLCRRPTRRLLRQQTMTRPAETCMNGGVDRAEP